ncbi:hypothetical protein TELCIR_14925 [Teladorsagia circumcincta]|uniref:Uncharacterized protein n=1 Tax=Teladorsagia circumcincta TaxID=45464 RepID=A0A2G9TZS1_TELCI|nr:hypothetical protein TELCIR_14925 [Teladorsagia circumcincta]
MHEGAYRYQFIRAQAFNGAQLDHHRGHIAMLRIPYSRRKRERLFHKLWVYLVVTSGVLILIFLSLSHNIQHSEDMYHYTNVIVHFDLKGAPPKIQYFLDLLKLVAKSGATVFSRIRGKTSTTRRACWSDEETVCTYGRDYSTVAQD